jgi:toxin ParE1/3/4
VIRWTEQALADLESVHDYISRDNVRAAERTIESILRGLETAAAFPHSGRNATRMSGTRELILAPYIVVYRVKPDCIEVLAVLHGSRRWPRS